MVTPKDVQGYAAFSNEEGAVVASTSLLFQIRFGADPGPRFEV